MSEPLTKLGITKPRIALLNELGINDVDSLLTYYPYRYDFLVYHQPEFDDFSITADGVITASAKMCTGCMIVPLSSPRSCPNR